MWGSASTASASGKKSERRTRNSSSTFFCIPNLQSRLISSFGMQLIAAVNSTNWKIVTLFIRGGTSPNFSGFELIEPSNFEPRAGPGLGPFSKVEPRA